MTTITFTSRAQHRTGLLDSVLGGLATFIEGIREGRDMASAYNRLSRMSDDELRKRGLTRGDIGTAVATGRGL